MKDFLVPTPHVLRAAVLAAAMMPMAFTQAAEIRGTLTSDGIGLSNTPVTAFGAPVSTNAALPIPDTTTVLSTNAVSLPGTVGAVRVSVNISHTFRGDLELSLIHPDGTEVRLRNANSSDDGVNLITSYPDVSTPVTNLSAFNGKAASGNWRLRVVDTFSADTGVLNTWSLRFGPAPALSDVSGNYVLSNVLAAPYTVQPIRDGFVFNPTSLTATGGQVNVNFALVSGFISGRVRDNTLGVPGITVSAGGGFEAITDLNGNYRLVNLPPGNKTITAFAPGHSFSPAQIPNVSLGATNANFQLSGYPVAGRITDVNSNGVAGVTVSASSGGNATTDSSGNYVITAVPGAATVTPQKTNCTFSPTNRLVTVSGAVPNVNFVVLQSPPTITAISDQVIAKNGSTGDLRFDVNDAETHPALLRIMASSSDSNLIPPANIVLGGVGVQRQVRIAPATNQVGVATVTLSVTDESGRSASCQFTGRVNQAPAPGAGYALSFNGINHSATAGLGAVPFKGNYTVEAWAFAPSNAGPRTILSQGGQLVLGIDATGQVRGSTNWNTGVPWPFGDWHHVALVRESDNARLYLDGVLRTNLGIPLAQPSAQSAFVIGAFGGSNYWLGTIDEVRIWNAARTQSEIASNRLVRVAAHEPDLADVWRFDETFALFAFDAVPNGRTANVTGATRVRSPLLFGSYITRLGRNITDTLPAIDADGDPLTFAIVSPPSRGTLTLLSSNSGAFLYTADGLDDDHFAFSVSDGYSTSPAYPVAIKVLPDTNAPSISFLSDRTINEDTQLGPLSFTISDTERAAQSLTVASESSNLTLVPGTNIVISGSGTNRMLTLRPATNEFGTATITLAVSDGVHLSTNSFQLTVRPVNDPPVLQPFANHFITSSDPIFVPIVVTDVDTPRQNLNFQGDISDLNLVLGLFGTCANQQPCFALGSRSPDSPSGTVTVTVTATDGESNAVQQFQVTVNRSPEISGLTNQYHTFRNTPTAPISITVSDRDTPIGNVKLSARSSNPVVVEDAGYTFSGEGTNRSLVITPVGGRIGRTTISILAEDGFSTATNTFELFVEDGPIFDLILLPGIAEAELTVPTGINDSGQVVGVAADSARTIARAVIWNYSGTNATASTIPGLDSGYKNWAKGINNRGDVVATRLDLSLPTAEAYLYRAGSLTKFGNGSAIDIGDSGAILWRSNVFNTIYSNGPTVTNIGRVEVYDDLEWYWPRTGALDPLGNLAGTDSSGSLCLWEYTNILNKRVLGKWGSITYARGVNTLGDIVGMYSSDVAGDIGFRAYTYNYKTGVVLTNLAPLIQALGFDRNGQFFNDINAAGEIVGEGIVPKSPTDPGSNRWKADSFLYTEGRFFRLRDFFPRDFAFGGCRAFMINAAGDIAGYTFPIDKDYPGGQSFVLRRKRWVVGQPVAPPAQALTGGEVYRQPTFQATDGTPVEQAAQATLWAPKEQKFYFLRPIQGELTWYTTDNPFATNAPVLTRRGKAVWPDRPQIHVATAPVSLEPADGSTPYRAVQLSYSEVPGVTYDASTRTFNAPNTGYSVIRYLIAPGVPVGGTPDFQTHTNYFEVVRTIAWNDPTYLRENVSATVGTKVTDPRGSSVATNSFKSGWTINEIAPYDGAGADRAYDRTTQTGPIIPVNRDTASSSDDLVVAFYKKNDLTGALWPDLPARFAISWPTNPEKLVIANPAGSGPLPEFQYPDKRVYNQPNRSLPGFNPNEEHAFLAPSSSGEGVFALRNDLNRPNTSPNFVLLKYRNPTNSLWQFRLYQPVLTDATHGFTFTGEAGLEILPPYPLRLLTICPDTRILSGTAFRDHRGKFYASMGPTAAEPNPQVVMRYFYPMQPDFHYDRDGDGISDVPIGTCVEWDGIPPGAQTPVPIDVTYRIRWPADPPNLQIGETLLEPKRGLPGINGWANAQVIFDSLNPDGLMPLASTVRLYDPLSPRVLWLTNVGGITASYQFPPEVALQTKGNKQIFPDLPFYLRSRLSFDPVNKTLSFEGFLDEDVIGEPLLLVNVLSGKERDRILQLSSDAQFGQIVEKLYNLTRNPNDVNVSKPGQSPGDNSLLIGLTTRYTVDVTTGPPTNATTTTQQFFGTRPTGNNLIFLATNIVQEPLGDGPKALTAGVPMPSASVGFGSALRLDGTNDLVIVPQRLDAPQTFTLSAWFKTTSTGYGLLTGFRDTAVSNFVAGDRDLVVANGVVSFYVFPGGTLFSPGGFNDGQWHHAAATLSTTTGMRLYVDGNLVSSANVTNAYIYGSGGFWRIGENFNGTLDDVRIWSVARTQQQIREERNRPLTGDETGLERYWRFDELNGSVCRDSSTNLVDAMLHGDAHRVPSTITTGSEADRYVVLVENNDPALGALPVSLHVIRVGGGPFRGDLKILSPDNVFDERLTLRHSSDFGAAPDLLEFEWWYHPDNANFNPTNLPLVNSDGSIANANGWFLYAPALVPNKNGQNTITIGDGGETSQFTLSDNWFISRYRGYHLGGQTKWSAWVGDPASAEMTRAAFAPGWVKRVIEGVNPFEARTTNFHDNAANTYASMLIQAGQRYEGDIALNPSGENLLSLGLIEAYTTVLNRGRRLSIDGLPPVDSDPLNNALLLAASRISDLYMLLGNEAFADAQDPTIGFASDDPELGPLATATFAFKNQLDSLLEEELALLRGRDDSAAGVGGRPVYNRLLWNFTGSEGEVAYVRTYNIGDINRDGVINEFDAKILYPQGHGDAWGHYLTAVKTYYDLLRHPRFTWVPRTENVLIAGTAVAVDFLDERKFANAAAAKAKAGAEILDLTYRSRYVDDPEGQYQGYKDTRLDRAWGVTEWARRAGQGAYFDWLTGNAILPSTDPNTNHAGIQKIDRQTVRELDEIGAQHRLMQSQLDKADSGLNPLGLAKGAVPFDLDPTFLAVGSTAQIGRRAVQGLAHFDQILERAITALNNAAAVWNRANELSEALRRQQDTVEDFTANVADQERDFKSRLIEIFGYPYSGDIGPGKTYPSGYNGPDIYHYMYVNATELTGAAPRAPTNILRGFFAPFVDGTNNTAGFYFNDALPAGFFSTGSVLVVQFPLAQGGWAFNAPASFGSRQAPGELQLALSDLLQEETRLKIALGNYDALVKNITDAATLLQSRSVLSNQVVTLLSSNQTRVSNINNTIQDLQDAQLGLRRVASLTDRIAASAVDAVPEDVSDAIFPFDEAAQGVYIGMVVVTELIETAADVLEGQQNRQERAKEDTERQSEISIETASQDYEVRQQAAELLAMLRDEATLRLEAYNQAELVKQTLARYQAQFAAGLRLVEERTVFRQRTAGTAQQNRYKDMAFRTFRNEALQKYRAQFDLAARYVYLAAGAYDYELNFLGNDNRSGRDFFTDIIRQRTIGQLEDGDPVAGSSGLSDALGRLNQNFAVLKSRFGLNNPQLETSRFSLRHEFFRIRTNSDPQWRATLRQAIVPNLWQVPEFRRYCRPFAPESAGPQPGIVIRFPTTVTFGLNFFGFPLGGGDNAFDPSMFSTKINSTGVWFENYDGASLATAPRVYLVPAGMDVLRSPTGNSFATREFRVVDQAIPVPFPMGASALSDPAWIPLNDSLSESMAAVRRFASFRAYHDDGVYDETQTTMDTRLVGRSVWNTDWMLIIPGGTFLFDPAQGLDQFINSVTDIRISLQSYSYAGD